MRFKLLVTIWVMMFSTNAFSAVGAAEYFLGPEDRLEISIWNEDKLLREVLVRPDGRFSFPLVGEVLAAGKTPEQVRKQIVSKLSKYIPDPIVTVLVTKVSSYKVYVLGQVKKPGIFVVGSYVDVTQILAMAGGLTPFAAEDDIIILREIDGKKRVISFKYSAVKSGRGLKQNIKMKSGDVIIVP